MAFFRSAVSMLPEAPPSKAEDELYYRPGVFPGGQGCVFVPSLIVKGVTKQRDKTYVTKIFIDEESYKHEILLNTFVKQIDPQSRFTNVIYNESPIDVSIIKDEDIAQCRGIKKETLPTKKFVNYEYVGQSIRTIIDKRIPLNINQIQSILSGFEVIISKLILMNNGALGKKIFHNDIHPGNVMVDFSRKKLYLIDFGLASYEGEGSGRLYDPESLIITLNTLIDYIRSSPVATKFTAKTMFAIKRFKDFIKNNYIGQRPPAGFVKTHTPESINVEITELSVALTSQGGKRRKTFKKTSQTNRKTLRKRKH